MHVAPEFKMSLEANYAMGLWTAFVTRDGREVCVIVDSERDAVIAEAHRVMGTEQQPKAA